VLGDVVAEDGADDGVGFESEPDPSVEPVDEPESAEPEDAGWLDDSDEPEPSDESAEAAEEEEEEVLRLSLR
jgi:hypothetical protein